MAYFRSIGTFGAVVLLVVSVAAAPRVSAQDAVPIVGSVRGTPGSAHPVDLSSQRATRPVSAAEISARTRLFHRRLHSAAVKGLTEASRQRLSKLPPIPVVSNPATITGANASFFDFGYPATDAFDNENATSFDSEPPDQALCIGDGYLIEMVNSAITVYDTSGNLLAGPTSVYTFFDDPVPTDLISDPRCIYDSASGDFFFTATQLGTLDITGAYNTSQLYIGVLPASMLPTSQQADVPLPVPVFFDTTDAGGAKGVLKHKGCPCLEDEPLLGMDSNALFVSGNEFSINGPQVNGAQIYLISKPDLVSAGAGSSSTVAGGIFPAPRHKGGALAFSVFPAITPDGNFVTSNGGVEYLMSSADKNGLSGNKIVLWAVTNTCAVPSVTTTPCKGKPRLKGKVLKSEFFLDPPSATQALGDFPLGQSLNTVPAQAEELIDTGDDRMQQVIYSGGIVYGALNTAVSVDSVTQAGLAYFVVTPTLTKNGGVKAAITTQGYLGSSGSDLYDPSIIATPTGVSAMVFSYSSATAFPSVGYYPLNGFSGTQQIYTAAAGVGPEDGFTGYNDPDLNPPLTGNGIARWGDYSAAIADPADGSFWLAGEWIPQTCTLSAYLIDDSCGDTRGAYTNWGTFIAHLNTP